MWRSAFKHVKIKIKWKGKGIKEVGYNSANNQILVKVDPKYFRPTDINELIDYSKARREFWNLLKQSRRNGKNYGWKVRFKKNVKIE